MSFLVNFFLGGYNTSKDPTSVNEASDAADQGSKSNDGPVVEGRFFPRTLYKYNGHDHENILIAVKGEVFDCSSSRQFYGPSGPYSSFAGHDASRGLALNSFDLETVRSWDQPMDPLDDLTPQQQESLDGWYDFFKDKYPCLGTLEAEPGVNK